MGDSMGQDEDQVQPSRLFLVRDMAPDVIQVDTHFDINAPKETPVPAAGVSDSDTEAGTPWRPAFQWFSNTTSTSGSYVPVPTELGLAVGAVLCVWVTLTSMSAYGDQYICDLQRAPMYAMSAVKYIGVSLLSPCLLQLPLTIAYVGGLAATLARNTPQAESSGRIKPIAVLAGLLGFIHVAEVVAVRYVVPPNPAAAVIGIVMLVQTVTTYLLPAVMNRFIAQPWSFISVLHPMMAFTVVLTISLLVVRAVVWKLEGWWLVLGPLVVTVMECVTRGAMMYTFNLSRQWAVPDMSIYARYVSCAFSGMQASILLNVDATIAQTAVTAAVMVLAEVAGRVIHLVAGNRARKVEPATGSPLSTLSVTASIGATDTEAGSPLSQSQSGGEAGGIAADFWGVCLVVKKDAYISAFINAATIKVVQRTPVPTLNICGKPSIAPAARFSWVALALLLLALLLAEVLPWLLHVRRGRQDMQYLHGYMTTIWPTHPVVRGAVPLAMAATCVHAYASMLQLAEP